MRFTHPLIAAGLALAFATGYAATAQAQAEPQGKRGERSIDIATLQERAAERARAMDANGDGYISFEEMQAWREAERERRARERFARLDTDGDGRVSVEEFQAAQEKRIARLDRSGDGMVDRGHWHERRGHHRGPRRGE